MPSRSLIVAYILATRFTNLEFSERINSHDELEFVELETCSLTSSAQLYQPTTVLTAKAALAATV